jgi:hypothetical protein
VGVCDGDVWHCCSVVALEVDIVSHRFERQDDGILITGECRNCMALDTKEVNQLIRCYCGESCEGLDWNAEDFNTQLTDYILKTQKRLKLRDSTIAWILQQLQFVWEARAKAKDAI